MSHSHTFRRDSHHRKLSIIILAFLSSFGILLGMFCAGYAGTDFLLLVRTAFHCRASTVGLVFSALLPFLIVAITFFCFSPYFLFPFCFLECMVYGFVYRGIQLAFPSGGWLVAFFLLFTERIVLILLHYVCIRVLIGNENRKYRIIWICSIIAVISAFVNCFVIAPLLS